MGKICVIFLSFAKSEALFLLSLYKIALNNCACVAVFILLIEARKFIFNDLFLALDENVVNDYGMQ